MVIDRRIDRGIIFCQVLRTRHAIHEKPAITFGNQKCRGAAPSFSRREVKNRTINTVWLLEWERNDQRIENRRRAEPVA